MSALPQGFAELEPFVARWALAGSAERAAARGSSSAEERAAFHTAMAPRLARALDYLDGKGLAGLDAADAALMALCLAEAHVALAVEIQGPDETRHAQDRPYMRITRTPAGA